MKLDNTHVKRKSVIMEDVEHHRIYNLIMKSLVSKKFFLFDGDITNDYKNLLQKAKVIAWDIETSGLNWHKDKIGICQLYTFGEPVAIVKINDNQPNNLRSILTDVSVKKIFHHAMFDLRFMSYYWKIIPQNIACTKIAAKILDVNNKIEHSLISLLKHYLNIIVEKSESIRCSNWLSNELTEDQVSYAINDVLYLHSLLNILEEELKAKNLLDLAHASFAHIPVRVQLELLGYKDIYSYDH